jgi:ketopantoate reductase
VSVFNKAGLETRIEENLKALVWSKLLVNVGINALLPRLRVLAQTQPDLARNLANILDLTGQLGSVAAGAGAGRLVGKLAPAAEA